MFRGLVSGRVKRKLHGWPSAMRVDLCRIATIVMIAVIGGGLLQVCLSEAAGRWQLSQYDDDRLHVPLAPGASVHYFDASAVTPRGERPSLSSGLTKPRTDLSPQPEDYQ